MTRWQLGDGCLTLQQACWSSFDHRLWFLQTKQHQNKKKERNSWERFPSVSALTICYFKHDHSRAATVQLKTLINLCSHEKKRKHKSLGKKINDITLLINFSTEEVDCVETMHSRRRKWACLLCVSLLSGFVLTKKMNLYQKSSNKMQHGANWMPGCWCLFTVRE